MKVDLEILELLASKICHDLISPIGAINNGLEIMEELGPDAGDEVTGLIAYSANQSSSKLTAYRMAYGAGGRDDSIKPEDVYNTIESIVSADKKIIQNWDAYGDLGYEDRPAAFCKILISVMLLAMECLPKGGTLSVKGDGSGITAVTATGPDAGLKENMEQALSGTDNADIRTPKLIHTYMCSMIAQQYGYTLSCAQNDNDTVGIHIQHP